VPYFFRSQHKGDGRRGKRSVQQDLKQVPKKNEKYEGVLFPRRRTKEGELIRKKEGKVSKGKKGIKEGTGKRFGRGKKLRRGELFSFL